MNQIGQGWHNCECGSAVPDQISVAPICENKDNGQHLKERGQFSEKIRSDADPACGKKNNHKTTNNEQVAKDDDDDDPNGGLYINEARDRNSEKTCQKQQLVCKRIKKSAQLRLLMKIPGDRSVNGIGCDRNKKDDKRDQTIVDMGFIVIDKKPKKKGYQKNSDKGDVIWNGQSLTNRVI